MMSSYSRRYPQLPFIVFRPSSSMGQTLASLWPWGWLLAAVAAVVATQAPAFITVAAIVGIAAAVLILRHPVLGAYALVLSVPVQKAVSYDAGPVEITVTQTLFVFVLGVWWAWVSLREDRRIAITPIAVGLALFIVATLPSLWVTASLPDSLAEISRWLVTTLSYVIIVNAVQNRRQMNWLIVAMLASGMSEALLGLVQAYAGIGPESFNVDSGLTRAYGTIGAPNSFAGYINMSLPLALALAVYLWARWFSARDAAPYLDRITHFSLKKMWQPLSMTAITLILFWTLLTTLSRGAWIGLTAGVLAMVLAMGKRAGAAIATLFGAAFALTGLGLIGALPAAVTSRFDQLITQIAIFDPRGVVPTPENYALVERMVHWQVAGNMFLASPWVGVGIGNFNALFNKYGVQGWPYSRGHAHNYYLNVAAETGVVGLTFYLLMLIIAVTVAIRAIRRVRERGDIYGEAVAIGALGILVTFMAHNFFENLHALNFGIQWGAALALFTLVQGSKFKSTSLGP